MQVHLSIVHILWHYLNEMVERIIQFSSFKSLLDRLPARIMNSQMDENWEQMRYMRMPIFVHLAFMSCVTP